MKMLRSSLGSLVAALTLATAAFANPAAPGYVDFGTFADTASGKQFVEIEVDGGLLKLAAVFADKKDPEIAKLVSNLERVRVNVVGLSDDNRTSITDRVEAVRAKLVTQGWKRVVTVREAAGDNVGVFLKQAADDAIQGIVVTVIGADNQVVLVNVVGEVKLEQLATLGERLNIDPLRNLDVAAK